VGKEGKAYFTGVCVAAVRKKRRPYDRTDMGGEKGRRPTHDLVCIPVAVIRTRDNGSTEHGTLHLAAGGKVEELKGVAGFLRQIRGNSRHGQTGRVEGKT